MTDAMLQKPQPIWTDIRESFLRAMSLIDEAQARQSQFDSQQEEVNPLTGELGAEPSLDEESGPGGADMVALRVSLRKVLDVLRQKLSRELSEREVYFVLFPLVIYIDELVQLRLSSIAAPWQPFQRELYKIDNGGERFYQGIDNLLSKSDTPPIIFEVFYFCLVHGFRGRYVHDSEKVKFYRSVLSQRIPTRHLVSGDPEKKPPTNRIHLVPFPKRFYAAAVAVGALGLVCAYLASALELHLL